MWDFNSKILMVVVLLSGAALLPGCSPDKHSPDGFSLPEGNAKKGEEVLLAYNCLSCHTLNGYTDSDAPQQFSNPIPLGGELSRVKTYAELVTSVINPSHTLADSYRARNPDALKSPMRNYNSVLTVEELIDLITFLQGQYKVHPYPQTHYETYINPMG